MTVVSITTPFSELAKVGQMDLLRWIFGQVIIPQKVYDEQTTHRIVGVDYSSRTLLPVSLTIKKREISHCWLTE
ncbi:MAG: hypothetical protein GDA43_02770 [Hormoscilla sp. SP5CHS1]|nr:hypothetical protein [Hormoscilla sp. SP5CHS1]